MKKKHPGKNRKKSDYIELQETTTSNLIHITPEENRMIIPKEVKNVRSIINNQNNKYDWETHGTKIITPNKLHYTKEEKKILKSLFLQKMPEKFRKNFWLTASGARREMANHPKYYEDLTMNFPEYIPSPYEHQIDIDLHRTFPDESFFMQEANITKLKNVLLAYSRRNLSIGYCQGFNFIVGRLLKLNFTEEETFWLFAQLIENILPLNYYSELAGIMIDCTILIKILKHYLPTMVLHLNSIYCEMSLNNLIYKWFVSVYIQNISSELSLIIWDMLFLEGGIVMFKSALGILKILKDSILSQDSMEGINTIFEENTKHLNDSYTLIYYLALRKFEFDYEVICKNRLLFQPTILENIRRSNESKITHISLQRRVSFVDEDMECLEDWPLCIYDVNYKYQVLTHLVFKVLNPPNVIDNYFFERSKLNNKRPRKGSKSTETLHKINIDPNLIDIRIDQRQLNLNRSFNNLDHSREKIQSENYKDLLIERRHHYCLQMKDKENKSTKKPQNADDGIEDLNIKRSEKDYYLMKRRSQSVFKKQTTELYEELNFSNIIRQLDKEFYEKEDTHIFETFKPKPLMDIEDYIIEDLPIKK